MAITGSLSLNNVTKLATTPHAQFWVYLNLSSTSDSNFVEQSIYLDSVLVRGPDDISSHGLVYGTVATPIGINVAVSYTGSHLIEIEVKNSGGDVEKFSIPLFLDVQSPQINDFSLGDISLVSNIFYLDFDVSVYDDAGISKTVIRRLDDSSNDSIENFSIGIQNHVGVQSIIVPNTIPNGTDLDFVLDVYDYSDNQIASAIQTVKFVNQQPTITNFVVKQIVQTATDFVIDAEITTVFTTYQSIDAFSCNFQNPTAVWQPYLASGGSAVIPAQVVASKTNPAGTYTLYAHVRDNFGNISTVSTYSIILDDLAPLGAISMDFAEKIGSPPFHSYYANLHFTATDAGNITHYSYSDIGPADLVNNWQAVTPTTTLDQRVTYNLGQSGSKIMYVQYRDFSGNESPIYPEAMNLDTTPPDSAFAFTQGELRGDGDYDANFYLTASDNDKIKFIKFYGTNNATSTIISGHTNDWQPITEVANLSEPRSLIIPSTESEDELKFYFQVRDKYGNESSINTEVIQFDKNKPTVNSISYADVTKYATEYRIHTEIEAIDNYGITAYRYGFGDLTTEPWTYTTKTTHLVETTYLDIPVPAELNVSKTFRVQVRDAFGNISDEANTNVQVNDVPPSGSFDYAGSSLTPTQYILSFDLNATDPDLSDNVYWYSLVADDVLTTDWKKIANANSVISETVTLPMPRTSTGRHDFYLRFADLYKNESPVYNKEVDLDAISVVGSITLNSVSRTATSYTANVYLDAIDNNKVAAYIMSDSESGNVPVEHAILPTVTLFQQHVEVPIGNTAGPKTISVIYKDAFDNQSSTYTLNFDLDKVAPNAVPYFAGLSQNTTHRFFDYTLDMTDDNELDAYKFWDNSQPEPDWTNIPRSNNIIETKTFELPLATFNPTFFWKVRDFFGNENSGSDSQMITLVPPKTTLSANTLSPIYSIGSINVGVDYDLQAHGTSKVDLIEVDVNSGLHTETVNFLPTLNNQIGTYWFEYPIGTPQSDITIHPTSNYGVKNTTPTTFTTNFDGSVPTVANTEFIGSYSLGTNFVLRIRVDGSDTGSGIRKIILSDPSGQISDIEQTMPLTHAFDHIFPFSVTNSYPASTITPTIYLEDLLGNRSTGNTLPSIYLDSVGATIANVVINDNITYPSPLNPSPLSIGSNTQMIDVSFDATDVSGIEYYTFSPHAVQAFNSSWTAVSPSQTTINVSETIDVEAFGIPNATLGGFFIHVRDRFGNSSVAGGGFEYDRTLPTSSISFSNYIEREDILGVEHFVIPYTFTYNSDYAEVLYKNENNNIGGVDSPILKTLLPDELTSNTYTEAYKIPVANYGSTKINVSVIDRFQQTSSNSYFNVKLEDTLPLINDVKINNGAQYTNDKTVALRLDVSDDTGVVDYLFSNTANLVWNTPGWANIPYGPHTNDVRSYTIDLEAIGFDQGVCNVYSYVKDFCQNVANTKTMIIYDKEAPVVTGLTINTWSRTATTYEISLNASAYDVTSGLQEYYISQNKNETIYQPVPLAPIVGTANSLFQDVEHVSVRDTGKKYFYFQIKDAAGNVSAQANTYFYIDAVAPVAAFFAPYPNPQKYYLNEVSNTFSYTISDDYALSAVGYQFDGGVVTPVKSFTLGETTDTGSFSATSINTLTESEHTIFLVVRDTYDNTVRVPYEFYYDNTPPTITNFSFKEVRPDVAPPCLMYDVEFLVQADDTVGIDYYELYDNDTLKATVPVNDSSLRVSPKLNVPLTSIVPPTGLDIQFVMLEDDQATKVTEIFALVRGYSATSAENDQIIKVASSYSGASLSDLSITNMTETNINNMKRGAPPAPQTLDMAIPTLDTSKFMFGSYSIIRLEQIDRSGLTPPPYSDFVNFMKNEASFYKDSDLSTTYNQYNQVIVSPVISNASSDTERHDFTLKVYDYAGNMIEQTISKIFHDGTAFTITNFQVNSLPSISLTTYGAVNLTADIDSNVDVTNYAFSIHPTIDFHSDFWQDFSAPYNLHEAILKVVDLDEFSLGSLNNTVWLHSKDDNGNIISDAVTITVTTDAPVINSVSSPIDLIRQGNYYVGDLIFTIDDVTSDIEAYAIGFEKDPNNFKSIPLTNNATITQKFKIPAKDIDGSKIMYVRLRDENGNESSNYRVSIRVLDFELIKFDVTTGQYLVSNTNNVNVLFDLDSNPLDLEYGYEVDNSNEPVSWSPVSSVIPNSIGEYEFTFNLDVVPFVNGPHDLYVWLKSKEGEKEFRKVSFVSEQSTSAPYGILIVKKTLNDGFKKKIWLEANLFDDGVGVAEYSLVDSGQPQIYETINIIQNRKITKLFEYDALANTTNTFSLDIKDAAGESSSTVTTTVDLSSVY